MLIVFYINSVKIKKKIVQSLNYTFLWWTKWHSQSHTHSFDSRDTDQKVSAVALRRACSYCLLRATGGRAPPAISQAQLITGSPKSNTWEGGTWEWWVRSGSFCTRGCERYRCKHRRHSLSLSMHMGLGLLMLRCTSYSYALWDQSNWVHAINHGPLASL
jgi:hypothetical protein